jgi:hypothetical protein
MERKTISTLDKDKFVPPLYQVHNHLPPDIVWSGSLVE